MLSKRVIGTTILMSMAGSLAWGVENQYFNVFMYNVITPDPNYITWMVAASAVVATVTSIVMGAISDTTRSKWGRRKPYMVFGTIGWALFTIAYPFAAFVRPVMLAATLAIFFDCLMTFFGSTASDSAFNAWIPEVTTIEERGRLVGVAQLVNWIGTLFVFAGSGFIIEYFGYYDFFVIIGVLTLVLGVTAGIIAVEPPTPPPSDKKWYQLIADTFKIKNLREYRNFFIVATASMTVGIGTQVFFPFLLIYVQHGMGYSILDASIIAFIGILVGGIAMGLPAGFFADKIGRKRVGYVGIVGQFIALSCILPYATGYIELVIGVVLWLSFSTLTTVALDTLLRDLFPKEKRGQFAGYRILFQVALTMVPGPIIGNYIVQTYGTPIVIEGQPGYIPPPLIFIVGGIIILIAALPLFFAKETLRKKEESKSNEN